MPSFRVKVTTTCTVHYTGYHQIEADTPEAAIEAAYGMDGPDDEQEDAGDVSNTGYEIQLADGSTLNG